MRQEIIYCLKILRNQNGRFSVKKGLLIFFSLVILGCIGVVLSQWRGIVYYVKMVDGRDGFFYSRAAKSFGAYHYGRGKALLSWDNCYTKNFDHVEIYYGETLKTSSNEEGEMISLKAKKPNYVILNKRNNDSLYYTLYAIDRYGRYSKPKHTWLGVQENRHDISPEGIFSFTYHYSDSLGDIDDRVHLPYYVLENDFLRLYFSNGVIIALEDKKSDRRFKEGTFGFLNSILTPMDIGSGKGDVFSIYRKFHDESLSYCDVFKTYSRIVFTRIYKKTKDTERIEYLLQGRKIHMNFVSENKDDSYGIRINFIGDENYRFITSWKAYNVSSIIDEPDLDNTDKKYISEQYARQGKSDYVHHEDVFNDDFPYKNSRKFLKINPDTRIVLFNERNKVFSFSDIDNEYLFYKNCSGEEGFTFGDKWPYKGESYQFTNKNYISITMQVH